MAEVTLTITWLGIAYALGIWVGKTRRIPWMPWKRFGEKPAPEMIPGMPAEARLPAEEYRAADARLERISPLWKTLTPERKQVILKRLGVKAEATLASVTRK